MAQIQDNLELEIIALLKKKENHVRGIAKDLGQPHSTVGRKLSALKRGGIVDSNTEGKNKVFFLKDNLIAKHHLLQAEIGKSLKLFSKHPEFTLIFQDIINKTDERLVILFGSYAKGTENKDSDIDIYIETKNRSTKKTVEAINSRISAKIGAFDTSSPLIKEIMKDHIIIKGFEEYHERVS